MVRLCKEVQAVGAMPARRVVLCTYPGLYPALLLNGLLDMPGIDVVGIIASTRILTKRYGYLRGVWHNLRHSGMRYLLFQVYSMTCFICCSHSVVASQ